MLLSIGFIIFNLLYQYQQSFQNKLSIKGFFPPFKDISMAMHFQFKEDWAKAGYDPDKKKILVEAIETTFNSIWRDVNRTSKKIDKLPEVLKFKVSVNRCQFYQHFASSFFIRKSFSGGLNLNKSAIRLA